MPLTFLLWQSFLTPQTATVPARYTLDNFRTAYFSTETFRLFLNSVEFAIGAAALSLCLGTALAWMNERTNTPFKKLFFGLSIIPLVIPSILFAVSWIMLASPKIGIINGVLQGLFSTDTVFVDIYTMTGMVWVDGLHYSPMAFLLDDGGLPLDGSGARGIRADERSLGARRSRATSPCGWPGRRRRARS